MTDQQSADLKPWQEFIAHHARNARVVARHGIAPKGTTMAMRVLFLMPRPKGHYLPSGDLSADGKRSPMPIQKPDVDKLVRAVMDALTGTIYVDDSQVVGPDPFKIWAARDRKPGAMITTWWLDVDIPSRFQEDLARIGIPHQRRLLD